MYIQTANLAVEERGFDGVEVHSGNGYLPEQFLSSNINRRTDEYGCSPEKRCKFVIELVEATNGDLGENRLALRLTPFGLYNQARGVKGRNVGPSIPRIKIQEEANLCTSYRA